jgi:hypothetical protein
MEIILRRWKISSKLVIGFMETNRNNDCRLSQLIPDSHCSYSFDLETGKL